MVDHHAYLRLKADDDDSDSEDDMKKPDKHVAGDRTEPLPLTISLSQAWLTSDMAMLMPTRVYGFSLQEGDISNWRKSSYHLQIPSSFHVKSCGLDQVLSRLPTYDQRRSTKRP
jgi:hypothetical protein